MLFDITGPIYTGMWGNGSPFPDVVIRPVPQPPWLKKTVYCEIFDGMHSQTGTYLETPAHWFGDTYQLTDVPIEKLVDIPCTILRLDPAKFAAGGRVAMTAEDIDAAVEAAGGFDPGTAMAIWTDWGKHWRDADYQRCSPYFSLEGMRRVLSYKPFLLATDSCAWENRANPQGFFPEFYAADILMLAPVILPAESPSRCTLTALPIRVEGTSCAPCRAYLKWE